MDFWSEINSMEILDAPDPLTGDVLLLAALTLDAG